MPRKPSAKRYALAMYQLAKDADKIEKFGSDLQFCEEVLREEPVASFVSTPRIRAPEKTKVIVDGLPGIDDIVYNLIGLLITRDMLGSFSEIRKEYGKLLDQDQMMERAHVRSAIALTKAQIDGLARNLGTMVGKRVELTAEIDSSILAGLVAKIGDKIIDGSARTKLRNLRKSLSEVT